VNACEARAERLVEWARAKSLAVEVRGWKNSRREILSRRCPRFGQMVAPHSGHWYLWLAVFRCRVSCRNP